MILHDVNTVANLLIVVGYILVPFFWLPYLPLTKFVLFSGIAFFLTCAMTHLAMAFGLEHAPWMVWNHVIQAVSVLCFVLGFSRLLKRAASLARQKQPYLTRDYLEPPV